MKKGSAFLVEVGIRDLPFPMKIPSGASKDGQDTVANISIRARIMKEFEAEWIDRFIHVAHRRRDAAGIGDIEASLKEYAEALRARSVRIDIAFPYFVEKRTPKSGEPSLVKYDCSYSCRYPSLDGESRILFGIDCPVITSYPVSGMDDGVVVDFPQLSVLHIDVQPTGDLFPEDLAALADEVSLAPVYSYLSREDQIFLMDAARKKRRTGVDAVDQLRLALAKNKKVGWYSIEVSDHGPLRNYTTFHGLEKSRWVPGTFLEDDEA